MAIKNLFAYPFRIFFISTAAWAIIAVFVWVAFVTGLLGRFTPLPSMAWHQHEMLFGFLTPAIAGFLLTAVCVWTGTERLHGLPLVFLWLVWLAGRMATTMGGGLPDGVLMALVLVFLPLVAIDAAWRICSTRQWCHLLILVILGLLWLMEIDMLLNFSGSLAGPTLVMAALLMLVVGGRITPAFSASWLRSKQRESDKIQIYPWLERTLSGSFLALFLAMLFMPSSVNDLLVNGLLAAILALISLVRILLWRGWLVIEEPLLWILHLSLLWIPVGLLLLAGNLLLDWPATAWQHAVGTGATGGLILGVMSRVALGHTGRPLKLPGGMVTAFYLVHGAAAVRVLTALDVLPSHFGILCAALLWVLAFSIFLWRYMPILTSPRIDGQPG